MQLAGEKCSLCNQPIVLALEGTWCVHCGAILHVECAKAEKGCPKCHQSLVDPSAFFVYCKRCPNCGELATQSEACRRCGTKTRWDTMAEYKADRASIHFTGLWDCSLGLFLTLFGLGLLGFWIYPIPNRNPWGIKVQVLLALPFTPIAVLSLRRGISKICESIPALRFR